MRTVIVSGYFNPLHGGHLDLLESAKTLGDRLVVIVNNDIQVALKGSCPFLDEQTRLRIIRSLSMVDLAYISTDTDETVCRSLIELRTVLDGRLIFANGGDRGEPNNAEAKVCRERCIDMVFGLGTKIESSSKLIESALSWKLERRVEELLQK